MEGSNQRGSGPAKGYTEALEQRLRETETALLRLWDASSSDAIERAFAGDIESFNGRRVTPSADSCDSGPAKAGLIKHWEEYPLESATDIQRWAADVVGCGETASVEGPGIGGTASLIAQPLSAPSRAVQTRPTSSAPPAPPGINTNDRPYQESTGISTRRGPPAGLREDAGREGITQAPEVRSQAAHGRFEMSEEFRRQFLW